jgi:glyoxylase-like metal-dependent hydrolase (beta-lactamase superfamily II)
MGHGVYPLEIGSFECQVISDGTFAYSQPAQLFFANVPQEHLEQALLEHDIDLQQWDEYVSPYPGLAINTGQHQVLVDTGAGPLAPSTGKLIENLRAAGIAPEDIDVVILTHGHPDHIGGNIDGQGQPAFKNARYVMWKDEWDFWISEPDLLELRVEDHLRQLLITFANDNLPPIRGQLDLIERETEIVPGIHAVSAAGHTPGHMALAISSEGAELLCISDAALHPIHVERPDWYSVFDLAPALALTSRRRLMDRAAAENALVFAYHFPAPGLGHVTRKGDGWEWQPIDTMG